MANSKLLNNPVFREILFLDPGLFNLRNAIRSTIAIIVSFFIISILAKHLNQPPTLAFLGVMIALISSIAVADLTKKDQIKTFLLLPFVATLGLTIAVSLHNHHRIQLAAFLVVTFLAVSIRRFGVRWFSLGFVAFMSFCTTLFFPISLASVPLVFVSICLAVIVVMTMRYLVLPDRPIWILNLLRSSFRWQIRMLLRQTLDFLSELSDTKPDILSRFVEEKRIKIRSLILRLNELGIFIEQFIENGDLNLPKQEIESLQMALFEREISIRQLLYTLEKILTHQHFNLSTLDLLKKQLKVAVHSSNPELVLKDSYDTDLKLVILPLHDLYQSFQKELLTTLELLNTEIKINLIQKTQDNSQEAQATFTTSAKALPSAVPEGLHLSTRQAIQATLATAIASILGISVSPERWYWAALAAFVVFSGATRGETLYRASIRIIGTTAGLILGFVIAYLLSGYHSLEWSVVLLCIFVGLFGARMAFGFWSAFSFTVMFLVLYDVMGLLTNQILILRFEETIVGAGIAALVGMIIFPLSTRSQIRLKLGQFIRSIAEILLELPLDTSKNDSRKILVRKLKAMDREYIALKTTVTPVVGKTSLARKGQIPVAMLDATALAHFARYLATYPKPDQDLPLMDLKNQCQNLAKSFFDVAKRIENSKPHSVVVKKPVAQVKTQISFDTKLQHILERLSQTLTLLEERDL